MQQVRRAAKVATIIRFEVFAALQEAVSLLRCKKRQCAALQEAAAVCCSCILLRYKKQQDAAQLLQRCTKHNCLDALQEAVSLLRRTAVLQEAARRCAALPRCTGSKMIFGFLFSILLVKRAAWSSNLQRCDETPSAFAHAARP